METEEEYPGVSDRVKSTITDTFIIVASFFVIGYMIKENGGAPVWVRVSTLVLVAFLYEPIMVAFFGGSIGHKMNGLKVRSFSNYNKKLNIFSALWRFLLKYLLGWLSLLTVGSNKERRAIHDFGSDSIVLYYK